MRGADMASRCWMTRGWLGLMAAILLLAVASAETARRPVIVLQIDGPIGPATAEYVEHGLTVAHDRSAQAVVLRLNTPGGLDGSMRDIVRAILAAPIPVLTYVAPPGARAASAGTYIVYASHVAAMAPGTNLGAATPVSIGGVPGGEKPDKDDAMSRKVVNDAVAYLRSLAELRGRNVDWAEKAVREGVSLSATEAVRLQAADLMADDLAELLKVVDGRMVSVAGMPRRLDTAQAPVEILEPGWRIELLSQLTNPNIAFLLLMIGVYGIVFELASPGAIVPGVIGAISLTLGLYALAVLPVNYAGLALVMLGLAFMAGEAFMPSFGVLGFGGLAAFAAGAFILFNTDVPGFGLSWQVIAGTTGVSGVLLSLLLAYVVRVHRRRATTGMEALVGQRVQVDRWDRASGTVRLRGEMWRAEADRPMAAGDVARVVAVRGLTLVIEPAAHGAESEGIPS